MCDSMRLILLVLCYSVTVPWKSIQGRRRLEVGSVAPSHRSNPASRQREGEMLVGQGKEEGGNKANCTELAGHGMDSVIAAMAGRFLGTEQIAAQKQVLGCSMRL